MKKLPPQNEGKDKGFQIPELVRLPAELVRLLSELVRLPAELVRLLTDFTLRQVLQ